MSSAAEIIALCGTGVPLLGAAAGAIRYLIRILTQIERVTSVARDVAEQLRAHIDRSDTQHVRLADQVTAHEMRIFMIENQHPRGQ